MQLHPALGVGQGLELFTVKVWRCAGGVLQPQAVVRQGLPGRPGGEQLRLGLSLVLGILCPGLLLQVNGIQHQEQRCDEGHRVDGPELVLQGDIAKPGTHVRSSLIERKQCWQGAIIVPSLSEGRFDMRQIIAGRLKKARAQAVVWAASCSGLSPRCKATSRSTSVRKAGSLRPLFGLGRRLRGSR
ncbi:hypothetical protein D3C77_469720 [compost metagenome]